MFAPGETMAAQLAVMPFGARWTVERGRRRLSIHETYDAAIVAVTGLAHQETDAGEQAEILVRERDGAWRELVYSHKVEYLSRPIRNRLRSA
jgi:hypothetical protein